MKTNGFRVVSLCAFLALIVSTAQAGVAGVAVTISDAAGNLIYKGRTDKSGAFATGLVAPGNYVVQFNAHEIATNRNDYAIFAAAGKHRVVADAVAGAKFTGGGVAMRLKVSPATPIIGQVALGGVNALGTKIVNGRRYILVPSETGSLIGPRWVEEGTAPARSVTRAYVDDLSQIKQAAPGVMQ